MYVNFFNLVLCEVGNKEIYDIICFVFGVFLEVIKECIDVYGVDNYL